MPEDTANIQINQFPAMSLHRDNRTTGSFKVVSVTPNVSNGTVTETMTNNNGEVLIRIGENEPTSPINGVYDVFDAHHVVYTRHSSETIPRNGFNSTAHSVKTRQITKIKEDGTKNIGKTVLDTDVQNNNIIKRPSPVQLNLGKPTSKDACFYCRKIVYQKERIGPIKDVIFHKQCFHCSVCNSMLTLKNFCQNPNDPEDRRLYCKSHQPVPEQSKGNIEDKQIKDFINKPRPEPVNVNIRGVPEAGKMHSIGPDSLQIQGALHVPRLHMYNQTVRVEPTAQRGEHVDQNTMVIRTAMNVPKLDNINQTVRPVPALAHAPSVTVNAKDPNHYMTRQVQHQISVPTPPLSPQQVRFSTDLTTHYYNGY